MEINKQALLDWLEGLRDEYEHSPLTHESGRHYMLNIAIREVKKGRFDSPSTQEEIDGLRESLREWQGDFESLQEDRDSWRRVCERLEREKIQAHEERDIAVKALEDVKYQIQQSDHPAGLGVLTSINSAIALIRRSTDEATS